MKYRFLSALAVSILAAVSSAAGGQPASPYHVLPPITHGSLTLFPVSGGPAYDTSRLLTLDEGIRSGSVKVTEEGAQQVLQRPHPPLPTAPSPAVNQLVLVNNSDRPLLLLAGEVVTGGKQDRVIGSDRLVPPKSGPIDMSVFCVEPGRWTGASNQFGSAQMAQLSVRRPAMADRNQQMVWKQVGDAREAMALAAPVASGAIQSTTSYAKSMQAPEVEQKIGSLAGEYNGMLQELKKSGAKGVVVAINGNIAWADIFASSDLLERYWQKLIRSYAAESLTTSGSHGKADKEMAQSFVDSLGGNHEVVDTDPGVYRRVEVTGDGYKVFTLTALMAKTDFDVHIAKMSYQPGKPELSIQPLIRPPVRY